ncbi:hypothetical protein I6Y99_004926 [Vibrio parahaemolyticus]|uniref:hypothetical protein n=1 Tax=Vibrio parahaemolyticus TaxID=670 RepID=UPI001121EF18|nr:hypothetical protein [Vibrio parahaemolyticus]EGQ7810859.1 hypothetical protein [Vibrio parahaemolyticus]EHJ9985488.1 hypothetical protein [Vibrio parahaemolyticus]EHV5558085.1 hypothetical protein [Vibrio parahaemolyticus]MBD6963890.1 hypothetical protein [Vibrio parahaemolyticus]MBE4804884.1 hypothetical protein [Vibrio parahaemolyticus]
MSSTSNKNTTNKQIAMSRAQTIYYVISNTPQDNEMTEKARKAARKFKHRKSTYSGRRVTKEELKSSTCKTYY